MFVIDRETEDSKSIENDQWNVRDEHNYPKISSMIDLFCNLESLQEKNEDSKPIKSYRLSKAMK